MAKEDPPPVAGYPRPGGAAPEVERGAMSRLSRALGCGCLFVPAGLFALAMGFGLMMAEGPRPDGSIGQEPGRGVKILAALGVAFACAVLGALWSGGRPRQEHAGGRLALGVVLTVPGLQQGLIAGNVALGGVLALFGIALVVSAFVWDRPVDRS